MAKARNSQGQFVRETPLSINTLYVFIKYLLISIVLIPFLYHFLIRKNVVAYLLEYLNNELGCTCSGNSVTEKSGKNGYFS